MDYTEISNSIRMMIKAQGVDDKYIDKEETLYYDESGNIKHLIVKEGKLNADSDTIFVLGGVQADDNPLFVHFVASQHTVAKYHMYIKKYGKIE